MLDGKLEVVGVAGRTLTEVCGLLPTLPVVDTAGETATEAEDVDDAFECEW